MSDTDKRSLVERLRDPISVFDPNIMEQAAARIDALEAALNPSAWTKEMSAAWHQNIPDVQAAFYALYRAALHPSENEVKK